MAVEPFLFFLLRGDQLVDGEEAFVPTHDGLFRFLVVQILRVLVLVQHQPLLLQRPFARQVGHDAPVHEGVAVLGRENREGEQREREQRGNREGTQREKNTKRERERERIERERE